MCGVCGLVGLPAPEDALGRMLPLLRHRGPDNQAWWTDAEAGLGHARLAIVDISPNGNQPMVNEDGAVRLAANGEIYNSLDLRRELLATGHVFRSQSDNEVLLHGYEEHGEAFLPQLNGMFALAIWDARRHRLLLARDRLGIKPLYYAFPAGGHGGILFASEIKALLASGRITARIDPEGLKQYLTYANTFGDLTLHQGVRMLEPGQLLVWERGEIRLSRFWEPRFGDGSAPSFEEACQAYLGTAKRAVRRHLMSDVEVASYLSSGIDSPTVATLAMEVAPAKLATFTGCFDQGGRYDERAGARAVAARIGSRHTEVEIRAEDFRSVLDDLLFALDEPRMGMGSFSQYMVARSVSRDVRVILTGHGGDELFGGYPVFKIAALLGARGGDRLRAAARIRPTEWPHIAYFLGQALQAQSRGFYFPILFSERRQAMSLRPEVTQRLSSECPRRGLVRLLGQESDPSRRLTLLYLRAYLPGLFVVEDKISMAHSLESRTPLCDNELVDLALSLPLSLKLHGDRLKAIPKAAMRGRLPELLYTMPKRGFPTPLGAWLRGPLRDMLRRCLLSGESALRGLFSPRALETMARAYLGGPARYLGPLDEIATHRMWMLLALEAWLRNSRRRLGLTLELGGQDNP